VLLKGNNLVKKFGGTVAVNDVSFEVNEGEILAIIGPNGAGKSVLFSLISGLHLPTSGRIVFQGEDITRFKSYQVSRRGVARTFQLTALFDQLRVVDNLALGFQKRATHGFWGTLFHSPRWKADKAKMEAKILETLAFIDLGGKAFDFVSTLSQGEQRRLSIGIALASDPKLILFDEPTGGLIQEDTDAITQLIRKINKAGTTVCLIEHKMRMVMDLADRIVVLNYGRKIAEGAPEAVASDPQVIEAYLGRKRMLKLTNVNTKIGGYHAIHDVSLQIEKGDFVALLGGNGAGKSTLFRTIAGVLTPSSGTIEFKGQGIHKMPSHKIVSLGLSLCPEGRQLFPQLPVYKNLLLGAYRRKDKQGIKDSLDKVYTLFPILRERHKQMAGTFSGGEQQMLAIGRAIMSNPEMLLLDEPSMGLAPQIVDGIADVIASLNKLGITVFLSEQNAQIALMITNRGYVLENGRLVLEGPSSDLLHNEKVKKAYLGT
jgi:ABC-type branched-subunit amino acid transport system ATPase component